MEKSDEPGPGKSCLEGRDAQAGREAQPCVRAGRADWGPGEGLAASGCLTELKKALMSASEFGLIHDDSGKPGREWRAGKGLVIERQEDRET